MKTEVAMKRWLLRLSLACFVFLLCSAAHAAIVIPNDSFWLMDNPSAGTTISFSLVAENAWFAPVNYFGLYQPQASAGPLLYEVFVGSDSPVTTKTVSGAALIQKGFLLDGEFGFYLDSSRGVYGSFTGGIFASDPMGGHDDKGLEHMITYFDGSSYTLYFEDLKFGNQCCVPTDFNDMVVNVSGMTPTPLPGALFLLIGGIPFALRKRM